MEIDPVCGMEEDPEHAAWTTEFYGTIYYFCSPGCKSDFENNPEKYLRLRRIRNQRPSDLAVVRHSEYQILAAKPLQVGQFRVQQR